MSKTIREMFDELIMAIPFTNAETRYIPKIKVALEKQIPKKPIDDRFPWSICPNCNGSVYLKQIQEHIGNEETTYCEHCGQALDWGDCDANTD